MLRGEVEAVGEEKAEATAECSLLCCRTKATDFTFRI